ncbi:MAG: SUMF1/EgtB/PvdO family nonheme iron enzyme [Planctomycetota bacterium]|nr:SUMF1/EgtB/PvdO family nonheme iron enzyme [Planctomycetota bacterium]
MAKVRIALLFQQQDLSRDPLVFAAPRGIARGLSMPAPVLGGVLLISKIGQGGMGAVYYGIHRRLGTEVAVKVPSIHLADGNAEALGRFVREARIAARVRSPHLVHVMDVNQENGIYYLVMEFVKGRSAGSVVRDLASAGISGLSETEALDVCIAACEGLAAAHAEGIVHRDVKPDNILIPFERRRTGVTGKFSAIGSDGEIETVTPPEAAGASGDLAWTQAKLSDLGLARTEDADLAMTATAMCMGAPGYMSPEQAMDARTSGPPSDVFSMGATLYALLAGKAPFSGTTVYAIIEATRAAPHAPIKALRPDVSDATARLIDRCLAKNPAMRYPDAAALLEELRICRRALDRHAATITPPIATPPAPSAYPCFATGVGAAENGVAAAATAGGDAGNPAARIRPAHGGAATGMPSPFVSGNTLEDAAERAWSETLRVVGAAGDNFDQARSALAVYASLYPSSPYASDAIRKIGEIGRIETAFASLSSAIERAVEAQKREDWRAVLDMIEPPLMALGDRKHPNRSLAEAMINRARSELARREGFDSRLAEAKAFIKAGMFEEASQVFAAIRESWPDMPPDCAATVAEGMRIAREGLREMRYRTAMKAGAAAMSAGAFDEAERFFREALREKPGDAEAAGGLAEALAEAARSRKAAEAKERERQYTEAMAEAERLLLGEPRDEFGFYSALGDSLRERVGKLVALALEARPGDAAALRIRNSLGFPKEIVLDIRGVRVEMVLIPPGRFLMGSPLAEKARWEDEIQHEVTITRPFYIARHLVTQQLYAKVMGANPSGFKGNAHPVENVRWDEAMEFCREASLAAGRPLRLPTEAEWEYACRAGTKTPFYTGETLEADQANFDAREPYGSGRKGKFRKRTTPAGSFKPNPWGLYDMHGNVWEWCSDWYGPYPAGAVADPKGAESGDCRVLRGGSWANIARYCRSATRHWIAPDSRDVNTGFRLAADAAF